MKSSFPSKASRLDLNDKVRVMNFQEMISSLSKIENTDPSMEHYQYKGFWFPSAYLEAILPLQEIFKAQPSDIFVCGVPKTGNTWLQSLVFSIMTRDCFDDSENPLLTKAPHECVPRLEGNFTVDPTLLDEELPLLCTHIPYTLLPPSIIESNCKIIYIFREPKDTFVSLWHFMQKILVPSENEVALGVRIEQLDQEFKEFVEGRSAFGPYWDHVLGYWEASLRRPDRVFILKYEDLKADTLYYVNKLAEFIGKPFSKEEENQGVAEKIVTLCDIKTLRNLDVNKSGTYSSTPHMNIDKDAFFRKGEIGDWKNILTDDMAKLMDQITHDKFQSLNLVSTRYQHSSKE